MENRFGAVGAIKSPHVDLGAINGEQACALAAHLRAQSPGFQAVFVWAVFKARIDHQASMPRKGWKSL
jgi:hypothetical protein